MRNDRTIRRTIMNKYITPSYSSSCQIDNEYFEMHDDCRFYVRTIIPKDRLNLSHSKFSSHTLMLVEKISPYRYLYQPFSVENRATRQELLNSSICIRCKEFKNLSHIHFTMISWHIKQHYIMPRSKYPALKISEIYPQSYDLFKETERPNNGCYNDIYLFGN